MEPMSPRARLRRRRRDRHVLDSEGADRSLQIAARRVERFRKRATRSLAGEQRRFDDIDAFGDHSARLWAAQESARQLVEEAQRQAGLIVEEAEAHAAELRQAYVGPATALADSVEGMTGEVEPIAERFRRDPLQRHRLERLTEAAKQRRGRRFGPSPLTGPAAEPRRRTLALPSRAAAFTILYWVAVFAVSLVIVVALVLFLESRDLSSLSAD
jgi:hypothetical protein